MKLSPKDFFFNIAVFATLYISAVSLITLLFQYINYLFPDDLERNFVFDPYSGTIRFAIASLIIVFPLYLFFTRIVNKDLRTHPEKREGGLRKWLLYITLAVAGATVSGDLIALINSFLSGDLTTRFLLKVLVILVVVGAGFWYYLEDLRGRWSREEGLSKTIGFVVSALVLVSIVAGFFIIGTPSTARELRFDGERVSDLQSIQWQIVNFWQQKERLPNSLAELEDPLVGFQVPHDPATNESYEYAQLGGLSFELCALFARSSEEQSQVFERPVVPGKGNTLENVTWEHKAGRQCFERTIDPELFPPRSELR